MDNVASQLSGQWLTKRSLTRKIERMLVAVQDQPFPTNNRKARLAKCNNSPTFRMFKEKDETVSHIISECGKLAQKKNIRSGMIRWQQRCIEAF